MTTRTDKLCMPVSNTFGYKHAIKILSIAIAKRQSASNRQAADRGCYDSLCQLRCISRPAALRTWLNDIGFQQATPERLICWTDPLAATADTSRTFGKKIRQQILLLRVQTLIAKYRIWCLLYRKQSCMSVLKVWVTTRNHMAMAPWSS